MRLLRIPKNVVNILYYRLHSSLSMNIGRHMSHPRNLSYYMFQGRHIHFHKFLNKNVSNPLMGGTCGTISL